MDMVRLLVSIHWTLLFFTASSDQEFQGNRTKQEGESRFDGHGFMVNVLVGKH